MPVPRHALILTAGLGTRLRPLTLVRAKPAIPVAGVPLVRRIASWLVGHGVADLVLNLHYKPESVSAILGDGSDLGARVRYSWEHPGVLGSAGGPRLALPILGVERFLMVNGDTLTALDLAGLASAHEASGALVTMALVPNPDPFRYGGVRLDQDGAVTGFTGRGASAVNSWHFVGVQVVEARAFLSLAPGAVAATVGGLYDRLIAERRGSVRGFCANGASFLDIGTVEDYWKASRTSSSEDGARPPSRPPDLEPSATLTRSIVWDGVRIGAGALVDECIVTDGVIVPPGASYRRQILLRTEMGGVSAMPFDPPAG